MKNPNAVNLGRLAWKKRSQDPDIKQKLSNAGKLGAFAKHEKWKLSKLEELNFSKNLI